MRASCSYEDYIILFDLIPDINNVPVCQRAYHQAWILRLYECKFVWVGNNVALTFVNDQCLDTIPSVCNIPRSTDLTIERFDILFAKTNACPRMQRHATYVYRCYAGKCGHRYALIIPVVSFTTLLYYFAQQNGLSCTCGTNMLESTP